MSKAARQSARERLREERLRQAQQDRRRRILLIALAVVIAVAAITGGVLWQVNRAKPSTFAGGLAPVSTSADGTVTMAQPGVTKPLLEVYEDFQCPICKEFEHLNGGTIKDFAAKGKVKVVYHPIAFVNPEGSVRAAAAAQCVPGRSWMTYHDTLFADQPDEKIAFTVPQLESLAGKAKITDSAVLSCIRAQKYAGQVKQRTQAAFGKPAEIEGTPTLILDGTKLTNQQTLTVGGLTEALQAADHR
ncbi:DsbA family protein [Sphaerisporangium fuscum]|uniref:DsbA family protein n=1 Tax=Sphaerisporangium fuscum TaxID=2835868 RepID=UPI001BDD465D|nr:thioredoxin domain-containing protein [Sphaerisporangium fuscum]